MIIHRRIISLVSPAYRASCIRFFSKDKQHEILLTGMKQLQEERESLFGFTNEETDAWRGGTQLDSDHFKRINRARKGFEKSIEKGLSFSHLSSDGKEVRMVDVGQKSITQRIARAQSKVILPPEVMSTFDSLGGDLVGPKGPIFNTAQLAGIMAAKRTSELIPLCHPLPLDKVSVEIRLEENVAIIDCECRVLYKTGVEMEALTGATVAALTIYDMVKAVSHRVEIKHTILLSKDGGKRNVEEGSLEDVLN